MIYVHIKGWEVLIYTVFFKLMSVEIRAKGKSDEARTQVILINAWSPVVYILGSGGSILISGSQMGQLDQVEILVYVGTRLSTCRPITSLFLHQKKFF